MTKEKRGIKTVEIAGRVLQAAAQESGPLSLSEMADSCGLSTSQLYTYLISLNRIGLIKRDLITQDFEPGFLSLRLGIETTLDDPRIAKVFAPLDMLCKLERMNAFISVWSQNGPIVVRYREWAEVMDISFNLGSYLSLTNTSTGMLFSALLPEEQISPIIKNSKFTDESADAYHSKKFTSALNDIRKRGYSRLSGIPTPSISSLAVPVFDHQGNMLCSITVFNKTTALSNTSKDEIAHKIIEIVKS